MILNSRNAARIRFRITVKKKIFCCIPEADKIPNSSKASTRL